MIKIIVLLGSILVALSQSFTLHHYKQTSELHIKKQNKFNDFDTYWTHIYDYEFTVNKKNPNFFRSSLLSTGINSKVGKFESIEIWQNGSEETDDLLVEVEFEDTKTSNAESFYINTDEIEEQDRIRVKYVIRHNINRGNINYFYVDDLEASISDKRLELIIPDEIGDLFSYNIENMDYAPTFQKDDKKTTYIFEFTTKWSTSKKKSKNYLNSFTRDEPYIRFQKNNSSWMSAFSVGDYYIKLEACINDLSYVDQVHRQILKDTVYDTYIEKAYYYIQNNIKYAYVNLHEDGYLPHDTNHILQQKKADCKDYTVLMLKLFRNMGYQAYMVDVNAYNDDEHLFDENIKYLYQFNHAILYVNDGSKEYFLDGTGTIHNINEIREDVEGLKALRINDIDDKIEVIDIPTIESKTNQLNISINGRFSKDTLKAMVTYNATGLQSKIYRRLLKTSKNELISRLSRSMKSYHDNINVDLIIINDAKDIFTDSITIITSLSIPNFIEDIAGINGHRLNFLSRIYDPFKNSDLTASFTRLPRANYLKRVNYSIKYPSSLKMSYLPEQLSIDNDFFNVDFKSNFENHVLEIENVFEQKQRYVKNKDFKLVKKVYKEVRQYYEEYITF